MRGYWRRWRFWCSVAVPGLFCLGLIQALGANLTTALLVVSFNLLVVPPFARLMVRADWRAELRELQWAYRQMQACVEQIPAEQRAPYLQRLRNAEAKLARVTAFVESLK